MEREFEGIDQGVIYLPCFTFSFSLLTYGQRILLSRLVCKRSDWITLDSIHCLLCKITKQFKELWDIIISAAVAKQQMSRVASRVSNSVPASSLILLNRNFKY